MLLPAEADQPTSQTHLRLSQELGLQEQLQQLHSELQKRHDPSKVLHQVMLLSAEADQPTSQTHLQLSQELGLQEQLQQLQSELQRQHELPSLEGYEEHPLGDPLKLRSQFWELEVDTTTGSNSPNAPDSVVCTVCHSCYYY